MADLPEEGTILDEREEHMVSPFGGNPTLRIAHFLNPSVTSIDGPIHNLPSHSISSLPSHSRPKSPLQISFNGWRNPSKNWEIWVDRMQSQHQSVWKRAGIHEPIMNSIYRIHKDTTLVRKIAEKWCPETNTFVFPFGESTLTLEDMMILGGFSVLGHPVSIDLDNEDFEKIKEQLVEARLEVTRTKAARASQSVWMSKFMESGSKIEHEAFLAMWLSRFVFPKPASDTISKLVFPIAIHLARGTRIALAPAVLASLYRDLSVIKNSTFRLDAKECEDGDFSLAVWSPIQFIQIWAWERFPTLRENPNLIENDRPRLARWHEVKKVKVGDVGLAIDSEGESFLWRPHAIVLNNKLYKFYSEKEEWVQVSPCLDEELESFARCLRACELVGLECVERYFPHRVAMQFGMDQDLPGNVVWSNANPEIAWKNYSRPIKDAKLYIPPRLFESDVTTRYLEWWKKSISAQPSPSKVGVGKKSKDGKKGSRKKQQTCSEKKENDHPPAPGFPPKFMADMVDPSPSKVGLGKKSKDGKKGSRKKQQTCGPKKENDHPPASPGFPPKFTGKMEDTVDLSPGNIGVGNKSKDGKKGLRKKKQTCGPKKENDHPPVPPGCPPKFTGEMEDTVDPSPNDVCVGKKRKRGEKGEKKENNHPPMPPGFLPKRTEKTTHNDIPVPPGFPPKCVGVKVMDSIDEDKQTLAELTKKIQKGGNKSEKGAQFQNLPPSVTDNESLQSPVLMKTPVEKITSEPVVEGSEIVIEDALESRAETQLNNKVSIDNNQGETCIYTTEEIPGLELEARIIKLEIVISQLKSQRLGNRS
ncbi:uncharacterized protein LOC130773342 [Actinidia eriantha]|uniref:uncharacterized protein LOC130773342 n=1 Tax=Actinidia eriantha TaxID=165200 RepID=UPI002589E735|nr:uncharacterized protein LOC130773342 [Actinidia eriantha]XP_057487281.1 uncharacterized protein LOC130773342 [Actinidia eriantha]